MEEVDESIQFNSGRLQLNNDLQDNHHLNPIDLDLNNNIDMTSVDRQHIYSAGVHFKDQPINENNS